MTDALTPYREAYEETEETLVRVSGLARALYEITSEHPALNTSEPLSNAILSLARVIEEKAERAMEQHGAEWRLVVQRSGPTAPAT